MKSAQRFDYGRFAEALVERGLIDHEVLNHVLQQCTKTRGLLAEILVKEKLVSDWDISRVACELYHLPFLTIDSCPPAPSALDGYDFAYLRHYAIVPLDRFGSLVTVVMPGLVPTEVLEGLRPGQNGRVLAVVGSVVSNRRWINEHLAQRVPQSDAVRAPLPEAAGSGSSGGGRHELRLVGEEDWGNLFDAGDEAVRLDLQQGQRRPRG